MPIDAKHLADQLRALGVTLQSFDPGEVVHAAYVKAWKSNPQRPPSQAEIAKAIGVEQWTVLHELERLERAGRMLHPRRGVWVPVVKPRQT